MCWLVLVSMSGLNDVCVFVGGSLMMMVVLFSFSIWMDCLVVVVCLIVLNV